MKPIKAKTVTRTPSAGGRDILTASVEASVEEGSEMNEPVANKARSTNVNIRPEDGFSLEVDGKMKSYFSTEAPALKAATELKNKFPILQVRIYNGAEGTRQVVEATAP